MSIAIYTKEEILALDSLRTDLLEMLRTAEHTLDFATVIYNHSQITMNNIVLSFLADTEINKISSVTKNLIVELIYCVEKKQITDVQKIMDETVSIIKGMKIVHNEKSASRITFENVGKCNYEDIEKLISNIFENFMKHMEKQEIKIELFPHNKDECADEQRTMFVSKTVSAECLNNTNLLEYRYNPITQKFDKYFAFHKNVNVPEIRMSKSGFNYY
jgi:hypothetical protein